jgi:hypothetical protein
VAQKKAIKVVIRNIHTAITTINVVIIEMVMTIVSKSTTTDRFQKIAEYQRMGDVVHQQKKHLAQSLANIVIQVDNANLEVKK